jgi:hypothetical protein
LLQRFFEKEEDELQLKKQVKKIILSTTPAVKTTNYLSNRLNRFRLKWLSVAKLKARSEDSRQK